MKTTEEVLERVAVLNEIYEALKAENNSIKSVSFEITDLPLDVLSELAKSREEQPKYYADRLTFIIINAYTGFSVAIRSVECAPVEFNVDHYREVA